MAKVSIIGAGPAGLVFAYALIRAGYDVTVYSDRTSDQWLNHSPPTGTAFLYEDSIEIERELGMDFWDDQTFHGTGVLMDYKPAVIGEERIVVAGSFGGKGGAVDQRMRVHRWINDLEAIGGNLVIESVTPQRLDAIATKSDLTVVAVGKADLAGTVPRAPVRSVYSAPQRNLAMAICTGVEGFGDRADFTPVKFNFYGDAGEFFWVPYTHKSLGPTWCVLFEARAGGVLDRFGECRCGRDVVATAKDLIEQFAPWEWDNFRQMRFVEDDEHGWLTGRFAPTVRRSHGVLPSGGMVMPLGDAAVTFDPIGGQGGNHAARHARYLADAVITCGDGPFDQAWMDAVGEDWWENQAQYQYRFNNILLEPLQEAGRLILSKASQDRAFADQEFFGKFARPKSLFPQLEEPLAARARLAEWDREVGAASARDGRT